VSEETTAFCL